MKVLKLSKILDFLFWYSILFFIFFVWTRYFLHDIFATILISATLTFLVAILYQFFNKKKMKKENLTKQDEKNADAITTGFLLSTKQEILKTFFEKLDKKYNTKIKSDYLLVNDKVLKPIYTTQTITDKDVMDIFLKIKDTSIKKLIITCKKADESCYLFAKLISNKEIIILESQQAYQNIFKPLAFDVPEILTKSTKKTFQHYLSFALNKQRTKNYLVVSLFMLFASFVLRYNIYYLIFSSITGALALYSHFNIRFNKKESVEYI